MKSIWKVILFGLLLTAAVNIFQMQGIGQANAQEPQIKLQAGKWTTGPIKFTTMKYDFPYAIQINFEVGEEGTILLGEVAVDRNAGTGEVFGLFAAWANAMTDVTLQDVVMIPVGNFTTVISWAGIVKSPTQIDGIAVVMEDAQVLGHELRWTAAPIQ